MQTLTPASAAKPWHKFYPPKLKPSLDYPKIPVYSLLVESAKKYSGYTALLFEGKRISYKELDELSNRFANGLLSLGISQGSRVALILPNLPQFVICFFGAMKAGATVLPCNPVYREKELEFQLRDSDASSVVILNNVYGGTDFYAEFDKCMPRLGSVEHVFVTSMTDFLPPLKRQLEGPVKKITTFEKPDTNNLCDFLNGQKKNDPSERSPSSIIDPQREIAVLQYTGGTTGISKGAMLTHYNLVSNAVATVEWTGLGPQDITLAAIPFFHIYGMTTVMNAPIHAGQKIVIVPRFNAADVLDTMDRERVTIFPGVPTMYVALLNHPKLRGHSLRTVRRCLSGAAPLPREVQKKFNEITGGNLVEGYGLTEASPITHCNPYGPDGISKVGSIGVPYPDTDAVIVDLETGTKEMPVGEVGELAVSGPQIMKGYWNQSEETRNVLRDGWLLTGDIAKRDEDGYFYIVDRKKDMIDCSGFKVWPREVEEILYTHPDIKEAAVVGFADPDSGEIVKAYIVLKDKNKNPGAEAIIAFCKEKSAPYKAPRMIEFRDELPKSLIGKVLRRKLREQDHASSAEAGK